MITGSVGRRLSDVGVLRMLWHTKPAAGIVGDIVPLRSCRNRISELNAYPPPLAYLQNRNP